MSLNLQLTLALRSLRGIALHIVPVALNWAIVLEERSEWQRLFGQDSVLSALLLSCSYEAGQQAMQDREYGEYEVFFRQLFEVTRR